MILQREDSGKKFRFVFLCVLGLAVALLFSMKYDVEYNLESPLLIAPSGLVMEDTPLNRARIEEEKQERASTEKGTKNADGIDTVSSSDLRTHLEALGLTTEQVQATKIDVDPSLPSTPSADAAQQKPEMTPEQRAKREKLMEEYRLKKAAEAAYRGEEDKLAGAVVLCGRECQNEHKRKEAAYLAISTSVNQDLFDVLGLVDGAEAAKHGGRVHVPKNLDEKTIKESFDKKKAEIESSAEDSEFKSMQLQQLQDAYINVVDPELRKYYLMYGRMAPPQMRKVSARDGGWGTKLALRSFKNELILAWLSHFDSATADISVLAFMGFVGFLLPALIQLPRIIDMAKEIERRQDEMDELERKAAADKSE